MSHTLVDNPKVDIRAEPYLDDDVIEFLESILRPGFRVLESGGGGSSLWLAQRVAEVVTVETSLEWTDAIKGKAKEMGLTNLYLLPRQPRPPQAWGRFDLVCVDSPRMIDRYEPLVDALLHYHKPGGWVWLNGSCRGPLLLVGDKLKKLSLKVVEFTDESKNATFWNIGRGK